MLAKSEFKSVWRCAKHCSGFKTIPPKDSSCNMVKIDADLFVLARSIGEDRSLTSILTFTNFRQPFGRSSNHPLWTWNAAVVLEAEFVIKGEFLSITSK